jgi:hypothetical protein
MSGFLKAEDTLGSDLVLTDVTFEFNLIFATSTDSDNIIRMSSLIYFR